MAGTQVEQCDNDVPVFGSLIASIFFFLAVPVFSRGPDVADGIPAD